MLNVFDPYEIRARVAPSLIVSLPILTTLGLCLPNADRSWQFFVGSGVVALALLYGFTFIVRWLGRSKEDSLWQSWGGAPSTRIMRWPDRTLNRDTKLRISRAVSATFGIQLLSETEERTSPFTADQQIENAFRQVRELLRLRDKDGLWSKHNAEYGFARNLLGSRILFLALCFVGIAVCAAMSTHRGDKILSSGLVTNLIYFLAWVPFGWKLLPKLAKDSADRYAERAWLTFLALVGSSGQA